MGSSQGLKPVKKCSKKSKARETKARVKAPSENDPLYKFYVSLFRQNPRSQMAVRWLLEHNLAHIVLDVDSLQLNKGSNREQEDATMM